MGPRPGTFVDNLADADLIGTMSDSDKQGKFTTHAGQFGTFATHISHSTLRSQ